MSVDCKLSGHQELALALLPIPSAILSVLGSATIIYMAYNNRRKRKSSPYTRLLVAMSVCDIILSSNLSFATFARPWETSPRMYSLGNSATCTTVGFLNQATFATIFYQSMLSCYFVLTARFGFSNDYIAKKIEPWMHLVSIGYPLVCAITTLGLGAYDESTTMLGCWLGTWPKECQEDWGGTPCPSIILGYLWFGIPMILAFATLVINNLVILSFVRRQMPRKRKPFLLDGSGTSTQFNSTAVETLSGTGRSPLDGAGSSSLPQEQSTQQPTIGIDCLDDQKLCQQRRQKLVSSQAFLFVASFFLCNAWTTAGAKFESIGTEQTEMKILVQFYPVFACQAFFAPLQGFLNMLVYIRPRYLSIRQQHPYESRRWVVRRAIFGEAKKRKRLQEGVQEITQSVRVQEPVSQVRQEPMRLPYGEMVSSLSASASHGNFDHGIASMPSGDRWKESSGDRTQLPAVSTRFHSEARISTLDVISEYDDSTFHGPQQTASWINKPIESPDERWTSNETTKDSFSLPFPQRMESELENISPVDTTSTTEQSKDTPKDIPVRMPKRRLSPTP